MGITYSSVVDAPISEVFEWHARPGAITRLLPPWQPARVGQEAGSLRDGRAVLLLPGGVRWVAAHQPDGYHPPHQFVDQLVSAGLSSVVPWRHTHMFSAEGEAAGENETRVSDDVQTPVPAAALRQMFAYRHRQLAADLAAHRWARIHRSEPMTVAVTGASGLVGTALSALLSTGGHRVIKLVRHPAQGETSASGSRTSPLRTCSPAWMPWFTWPGPASPAVSRPRTSGPSGTAASGLPGGWPNWRRPRPAARAESGGAGDRSGGTAGGPRTFVIASAIGYYGADRGDRDPGRGQPPGRRLPGQCRHGLGSGHRPRRGSGPAGRAGAHRDRAVPEGRCPEAPLPAVRGWVGGRLGSGRQWLSWIGIDDLADVYLRALVDAALSGPVNAVAPDPVRNADYTRTLGNVLRRPTVIPVPGFGPRLLLGEEGARNWPRPASGSARTLCSRPAICSATRGSSPALRHLLGHVRDA